jgi:transposase
VNRSHVQPRNDVVCPSCLQLRRRFAAKQARINSLRLQLQKSQALLAGAQDRIRELEQAHRPTASNSSIAPSANPIGVPRPVVKKPTGRKPGGQVGHRGAGHRLLPVQKMDQVVRHRPKICKHCLVSLQEHAPAELVGRHQVAELPEVCVFWTEHQSYACRCPHCGKITRGMIPADIAASTTGPRLTAAIGIWGAWVKGSRRAVAEVVSQTLGCPISLGSIGDREKELTEALDPPYRQLLAGIREAPLKYVDETGWKLHGQDRWLFVGACKNKVALRIERTRTRPALLQLLDVKKGIICSDRHGIYDLWPVTRRQLCWAHLKRDFTAVLERGGVAQTIGRQLLEITANVFALWRAFRRRRISRKALRCGIVPLRRQMRRALEAGAGCGQKKTLGLCKALLKREKALWRFVTTPEVEPTNNFAERMLRPAVIWRKKSFGSHSLGGCRYVERMLSVIQTLRLRGVNVLDYLSAAVAAHRKGLPPPAIPRSGHSSLSAMIGASADGTLAPFIPKLRKVA